MYCFALYPTSTPLLIRRDAAILLAGCTSSGLSNVYLLSLSYQNASTPPTHIDTSQVNPDISRSFASLAGAGNNTYLEVRAGYMGMCISQASGIWTCSSSADVLANIVKGAASSGGSTAEGKSVDPLNLIWIAKTFQQEIVFDGLM
jgi:hypothetical protein